MIPTSDEPPPVSAVATQGLTKVYGARRVLGPLDLTVPQGSVFGLLGRNGAGKTTTIRILMGLARPTEGSASLFGLDAVRHGREARRQVAYVPDVPAFHPWMDAREVLEQAGRLLGLDRDDLARRVPMLLDLAGLPDVRRRAVGGYSRGMRQRLGMARALVGAPRLLVLDEPTSALDPIGRKDVLELIASLGGRTTVLVSTHLLDDAQRICDEVAILDHGQGVARDTMSGLLARHDAGTWIEIETVRDPAPLVAALSAPSATAAPSAAAPIEPAGWGRVAAVDGTIVTVRVEDPDRAHDALPGLVAESGCGLVRFGRRDRRLEDVFVELVTAQDSRQDPALPAESPGAERERVA